MTSRALRLKLERFPPALERVIRADIGPLLPLVPGWCRTLTVRYRPKGKGGTIASVFARMEYRTATIRLHPIYFSDGPGERREHLLHELAHVILWPLSHVADGMVLRLTEAGGALRPTVADEVRIGCESATEDLSLALLELLKA